MEISVALRKESVDRNACIAGRRVGPGLSLSARRAWIEIQGGDWVAVRVEVALRKESVDRNWLWNVSLSDCSGWFCSCGYPL